MVDGPSHGTLILAVLLGRVTIAIGIAMTMLSAPCSAQTNAPSTKPFVEDFPSVQTDGDDEDSPASIETGLPLRALSSPFRWGRLSLLSFTAYDGYDTSPRFQPSLGGSDLASFSFLAVYSKPFDGWQLDVQYQPYLWVAAGHAYADLTGSSVNLKTTRRSNRNWSWGVGELFHYTPGQKSTLPKTFVSDFGGGASTGSPLLSSGRDSIANYGLISLTDTYSSRSALTFHVDQSYYYLLATNQSGLQLPSENLLTYGAGASWSTHLTDRDTINVNYDYRRQSASSSLADTDYHTASAGWGHVLAPGLRFSIGGGPGWSSYTHHTTVQGFVEVGKAFRRGSVDVSFERTNGFSGVLSSYFNNHYDLRLDRSLSTHWHATADASYLQQYISQGKATRGELGSVGISYFMTRNWSVFGQARYLDIIGNSSFNGAEKIIAMGLRWSWVPDKE